MRRSSSFAALLATAGALSCGGGEVVGSNGGGAVASIAITPASSQVERGTTLHLVAELRDAQGKAIAGRSVFWSSDPPAVLTVSQTGIITGVSVGHARVAASVDGKSGVATVDVFSRSPASVRITPASQAMFIGDSVRFDAEVLDAAGGVLSNEPIVWATSAPTVAVVSPGGVVTAVGAGTARVSAISGTLAATAVIIVTARPVAAVSVKPAKDTVITGQTAQLQATATDAAGNTLNGRAVAWTTSAATVATVSASGVVAAVAPGQATITATVEGHAGSAQVTVIPVPVNAVVLSPAQLSVVVGGQASISGKVTDASGNALSGRAITFGTSDPSIATVSATGVVTGVAPGTATISGSSGGKTGTASVTVTPIPVASVSVAPSTSTIDVGATISLAATARDARGATLTGRAVTWTSNAPSIATVSSAGTVTGVSAGTAAILATVDGVVGTATVTVQDLIVTRVAVSPAATSLLPGQSTSLTATATAASGNVISGRPVSWSSSAPSVATVSAAGVVTAVAVGTATITATIDGVGGLASIAVNAPPVASVSVTPSPVALITGQTKQLVAAALDALGNPVSGVTVTWSSTAASTATVSTSGVVTGVAPGSATITATVGGKSGSAQVTVSPPPVVAVSVAPTTATIYVGNVQTLVATAKAADSSVITGRPETWTSSASSVASVSSAGVVTAVAPGTATIQVTIGGIGASASITTTLPPTASVSVAPTPLDIPMFQTQQMTATPRDSSGKPIAGKPITWSSSNPIVASVSASGMLTAIALGTATISAASDGKIGTAQVTVSAALVASVVISPPSSTIQVGGNVQLTATARGVNGSVITGRSELWSTITPTIVSVSSSGLVTGIGRGAAIVLVSIDGVSSSASVTVTAAVASVTVSPGSLTLNAGQSSQLTATILDAQGQPVSGATVSWSSSDTSVATVSSSGVVTALKAGAATITATSSGVSGSSAITVQ